MLLFYFRIFICFPAVFNNIESSNVSSLFQPTVVWLVCGQIIKPRLT